MLKRPLSDHFDLKSGTTMQVNGNLSVTPNSYLPIDKHGADLLFQVISQQYERGATIITSNRAYKKWP
jgi:hypothetical protein